MSKHCEEKYVCVRMCTCVCVCTSFSKVAMLCSAATIKFATSVLLHQSQYLFHHLLYTGFVLFWCTWHQFAGGLCLLSKNSMFADCMYITFVHKEQNFEFFHCSLLFCCIQYVCTHIFVLPICTTESGQNIYLTYK